MRATTSIGIVSGFTALFTSTLGGFAIACSHPGSDAAVVVSADASRTAGDFRLGLVPAKETARLATYASFAHQALGALSAKAAELGDELSTARAKDAPAKLVARAGDARATALSHLAMAKQSLANADAAIADGRNVAAVRALRTTSGHLHEAAGKLAVSRMLKAAAMHAAFLAAKADRLARADDKPFVAATLFDAKPFDGRHHCDHDGFRAGDWDGDGWDGHNWDGDGDHDWRR